MLPVDPDLHRRLKVVTAIKGMKIKDGGHQALEAWVSEQEES
jgi:hypothetical protein